MSTEYGLKLNKSPVCNVSTSKSMTMLINELSTEKVPTWVLNNHQLANADIITKIINNLIIVSHCESIY